MAPPSGNTRGSSKSKETLPDPTLSSLPTGFKSPFDNENPDKDTTSDPKDLKNPKDVINIKQLELAVKEHPRGMLEYLNLLRAHCEKGEEVGVKLNDLKLAYGVLQDDHRTLMNRYDQLQIEKEDDPDSIANLENDRLTKKVDRLEGRETKREKEKLDLKNENFTLRQQLLARKNIGGSTTSRSQKLPDPPQFTNGLEPTWDDWYGKISDKLDVNGDHWPDDKGKLAYIHTRLGGDAALATQGRRQKNASNPYNTPEDLLEDLAELYEDPDKEENARRKYVNLVQGTRKFAEFCNELQRLASILEYQEKQVIADLKDRLHPSLRRALAILDKQPSTMVHLRKHLTRLDNEFRAEREKTALEKGKLAKRASVSDDKPNSYRKYDNARSSEPSTSRGVNSKDADAISGTCYVCHKLGHHSRDCPHRVPKVSAVDEKDEELYKSDEDKNEYDRSGSGSDSDSSSKN